MDERIRQAIEQQLATQVDPATAKAIQVMVALAVERHFEQRTVWAWEWVKRIAAIAAIVGVFIALVTALL